MSQEKYYKILAAQEGISHKKAKFLIDRGLVFVADRQIKIARALGDTDTKLRIVYPDEVEILFEDTHLLALNKPPHLQSDEVASLYPHATLLHRLDRDTSGILLLGKTEHFITQALEAFRLRKVTKVYTAWVEGVLAEETTIDTPLRIIKGHRAFAKVDPIKGKPAHTVATPLAIHGKKTQVSVAITTGRTHQIRAHLASIGHPIVGDERYGSPTQTKRMLLHATNITLLGYHIQAPLPRDIASYK